MNSSNSIDKTTVTEVALNTINQAIGGLQNLKENINDNFFQVCSLIYNSQGKVVLTGIGKSGHIASKIAATLTSTGTVSLFLHPSEAMHGDIGILEPIDTVIAFSNSGNSEELGNLLSYVTKLGNKIIAVTRNERSTLGKLADFVLLLPKIEEACPLKLAPTTSTSMMLTLGDALAMALLYTRGFSKENFKLFHPGGSLGDKLKKASDIMNTKIPKVFEDTLMKEAILTISSGHVGCAVVTNPEGEMVGILTDGDLRRHLDAQILNKPAQTLMNSSPVYVHKDEYVNKILVLMNKAKISSIVVIENKKPIGIIQIQTLLKLNLL